MTDSKTASLRKPVSHTTSSQARSLLAEVMKRHAHRPLLDMVILSLKAGLFPDIVLEG